MTITLAFHSVWDQSLSALQKEHYEQLLADFTLIDESVSAFPILVKRKEKGGIVATVFICNGFDTPLHIQQIFVNVSNGNLAIVASHLFTPTIVIPVRAAMPWSFIFPPHTVQSNVTQNEQWKVQLILTN
ncbi:SLAP domain-containing protein [Sporosarcina limicola]|uniref:SLAP domain-containing protein n=1 Tax=Sporosarcina limicola TaxID=34101 RepID=A0A927RCT1_9BACL|nr:SLAP domain-containing protein [Sporosarcina limicola]MBE1554700.1 SLAP domain-containing protein [Sporosarcina limicola]